MECAEPERGEAILSRNGYCHEAITDRYARKRDSGAFGTGGLLLAAADRLCHPGDMPGCVPGSNLGRGPGALLALPRGAALHTDETAVSNPWRPGHVPPGRDEASQDMGSVPPCGGRRFQGPGRRR